MNGAADPEMDALSAEWKATRQYNFFSDDGILIREEWDKTSPKIAFLLKEPNDGFHEIRNHWGEPKKGNSRLFWRNINIWSYTVAAKSLEDRMRVASKHLTFRAQTIRGMAEGWRR